MNKKEIPDWAWAMYQAKQKDAFNESSDSTEESLNYLLEIFLSGEVPIEEALLQRKLDNHLAGYRQKVRRRQMILDNAVNTRMTFDSGAETSASITDMLHVVKQSLGQSEFEILTEVANGRTYIELSNSMGVSVGTLKSTVSRARNRVRDLALAS